MYECDTICRMTSRYRKQSEGGVGVDEEEMKEGKREREYNVEQQTILGRMSDGFMWNATRPESVVVFWILLLAVFIFVSLIANVYLHGSPLELSFSLLKKSRFAGRDNIKSIPAINTSAPIFFNMTSHSLKTMINCIIKHVFLPCKRSLQIMIHLVQPLLNLVAKVGNIIFSTNTNTNTNTSMVEL